MSPCFPCSVSIRALHCTPSPCIAGVCIVTDNYVQEFETCIKILGEYIPLSGDAGSILVPEEEEADQLPDVFPH